MVGINGSRAPTMPSATNRNPSNSHPMRKAPAAGFDASTTIKRSEFGITKYVPMISDDIKIHITSEAIDAKAYAESLKPQPKG